jgi:membrane protein
MKTLQLIWHLTRQSVRCFTADHAMQFGAAISFYAIVSLAPVLVIAVSIAGLVYGPRAASGEITGQIENIVGSAGVEVVQTVLANASGPGSGRAAILSGIVVLMSASAVFSQVQKALNFIFESESPRKGWLAFVISKLTAIAFVIGMGLLVIASLASSTFIARLQDMALQLTPGLASLSKLGEFLSMVLLFTLVFAVVFRVLPAAQIRGRLLFTGALVTSLLFNIGRIGVGVYLGQSAVGSAFGAAGSLLVVLMWLYYSSLSMLLGAEFTKALAEHRNPSSR